MCSFALVGLVGTLASGVMQAKASSDQANYQQGVAEYNAAVDKNMAESVRDKAVVVENDERQRAAQLHSKQRAIAASRGVDVDSGTPLDLQQDTEMIGEINALRIRQSAEDQASALETQAGLTLAEGKAAAYQGRLKSTATLIGTAGSVAGQMNTPTSSFTTPNGSVNQPQTVAPKWYDGDAGVDMNLNTSIGTTA